MATKRTQFEASSVTKRSRKALTLHDKMEIIRRYDRGQKTADIVRAMDISETTLRTILALKDKITARVKRTEDWIKTQNQRINFPLSMSSIQTKAREIYYASLKSVKLWCKIPNYVTATMPKLPRGRRLKKLTDKEQAKNLLLTEKCCVKKVPLPGHNRWRLKECKHSDSPELRISPEWTCLKCLWEEMDKIKKAGNTG